MIATLKRIRDTAMNVLDRITGASFDDGESPQPDMDDYKWPRLKQEARVGGTAFGVGVSTALVVRTAIRAAENEADREPHTKEQRRDMEIARRELWDMINGPVKPSEWAKTTEILGFLDEFANAIREDSPHRSSQASRDWVETCREQLLGAVASRMNWRADQTVCACGDRPKAECPGEWEQGCDFGNNPDYVRVHVETPEESAAISRALESPTSNQGKYDEVLRPFMALMERELHANSHKGDRPAWLLMSRPDLMLELYHHAAKLQRAAKELDIQGIEEYAADVANIAMMMVDTMVGLRQEQK